MTVERFRGDYLPFSNMYPLRAWIKTDQGMTVPTSEHAYMANRFTSPAAHTAVAGARGEAVDTRFWKDGQAAKELAHKLIAQGHELAYATDEERVAIMMRVVRQKLAKNAEILALLLATGEEAIYEGNTWGDTFWGVSPVGAHASGMNHLGKIYMSLRSDFRQN